MWRITVGMVNWPFFWTLTTEVINVGKSEFRKAGNSGFSTVSIADARNLSSYQSPGSGVHLPPAASPIRRTANHQRLCMKALIPHQVEANYPHSRSNQQM